MKLDNWIREQVLKEDKLFNRELLEEYQLNKINEIIEYARNNSLFYKNLYKDLTKINSLEEFELVPIISKEDIINSGNRMICVSQSEISRIVSLETSGTMGCSKRIYFTEEDQDLTIKFFEQGLSIIVEKNDIILVMLPYERKNSVGDLIKKALKNIGAIPILNGILESFEECANHMIENKVNSIVGMPADILALGRYLRYNNLNINIKSILLSADLVSNTVLEQIREIYNCKVFNHFGMTETGLGGAVECEYNNGMHIRENDLYMEIVNPVTKERVVDGQRGEVVVTTLTRKGMPLIRYLTGDISSFIQGSCECKSILKRLNNIKYRKDDRAHIGRNLFININEIDNKMFIINKLTNYRVEVIKAEEIYIIRLELCILENNNISQHDIENLLLTIPRIKKSYDMNLLNFDIKIFTSHEFVRYYNGKRKIICN